MTDIARLAFEVDSSKLKEAVSELTNLQTAAASIDRVFSSVRGATKTVTAEMAKMLRDEKKAMLQSQLQAQAHQDRLVEIAAAGGGRRVSQTEKMLQKEMDAQLKIANKLREIEIKDEQRRAAAAAKQAAKAAGSGGFDTGAVVSSLPGGGMLSAFMAGGAAGGAAAVIGGLISKLTELGSVIAGVIKESTLLAARNETLNIVMRVAGNNAGYTGNEMEIYADKVQKLGISIIEAKQTVTSLAAANINLSYSTKLAQAAQNLAVVGNTNSSETLHRLTHAIRTGNVAMLHRLGISTTFNEGYKKMALVLDKRVKQLTDEEKGQARMNQVLAEASRYNGIYEESMSTASKQILSMQRLINDLQTQLGEAFLPVLTAVTKAMFEWLKGANQHISDLKGPIADFSQSLGLLLAQLKTEDGGLLKALGSLDVGAMKIVTAEFDKWTRIIALVKDTWTFTEMAVYKGMELLAKGAGLVLGWLTKLANFRAGIKDAGPSNTEKELKDIENYFMRASDSKKTQLALESEQEKVAVDLADHARISADRAKVMAEYERRKTEQAKLQDDLATRQETKAKAFLAMGNKQDTEAKKRYLEAKKAWEEQDALVKKVSNSLSRFQQINQEFFPNFRPDKKLRVLTDMSESEGSGKRDKEAEREIKRNEKVLKSIEDLRKAREEREAKGGKTDLAAAQVELDNIRSQITSAQYQKAQNDLAVARRIDERKEVEDLLAKTKELLDAKRTEREFDSKPSSAKLRAAVATSTNPEMTAAKRAEAYANLDKYDQEDKLLAEEKATRKLTDSIVEMVEAKRRELEYNEKSPEAIKRIELANSGLVGIERAVYEALLDTYRLTVKQLKAKQDLDAETKRYAEEAKRMNEDADRSGRLQLDHLEKLKAIGGLTRQAWTKAWVGMIKDTDTFMGYAVTALESFSGFIGGAFADMATSGERSFRKMWATFKDMLSDWAKQAARLMADKAFQAIFNWSISYLSGYGVGHTGNGAGSGEGMTGDVPMSGGGSTPAPAMASYGNAAPSVGVTVNINGQTGAANSQITGGQGQQFGRVIQVAVQNAILQEMRPGGIIYSGRG